MQEVYSALTGQADYNVTLPVILSEWHKLFNKSKQFEEQINRVIQKLGMAYWLNWMPNNSTHNFTETLQQRCV